MYLLDLVPTDFLMTFLIDPEFGGEEFRHKNVAGPMGLEPSSISDSTRP